MNNQNLYLNNLHYFKCLDCLEPVVLPISKLFDKAQCECLGTNFIRMGDVRNNSIYIKETPCNTLCTDAQGPNCGCSCSGKNHGHGLISTVKELTIYRAKLADKAIDLGQRYRALSDKATRVLEDQRGIINALTWRQFEYKLIKIKRLKQWKKRQDKLHEFIQTLTG